MKDPRKRLGGGPEDAESVRGHVFFQSINWDDLLRKNIPSPFVPKIASPTDVSNFSEEFTNMEPVDSPGLDPEVSENLFAEYSYVAPSILFTENNVISEDMFRPNPDKKPSTSNLVGCILQVSKNNTYRVTIMVSDYEWLTTCLFHCQPDSALADANWAEIAEQSGSIVATTKSVTRKGS